MPSAEDPSILIQWTGGSVTRPETDAPPAFDEAVRHTTVDFNRNEPVPGEAEGPPPFTPYVAEYKVSGNEIISHDPHLNDDGA
jgi:hypothetical protein